MATFIQLCQRLRQEVGASGSETTVAGATGEWKRIVDWVSRSWEEIQFQEPTWEWMRKTKSFATVAGQSTYTVTASPLSLTDFAYWKPRSFRLYKSTVSDEQLLNHIDYELFRDTYLIGAHTTTNSRPTVIAVNPEKSLVLALPPDGVYTVTGEYYTTPTILSADSDTPAMPARFHNAIVYLAMLHYGFYEEANDVLTRARIMYADYMDRLRFDQLPEMVVRRQF